MVPRSHEDLPLGHKKMAYFSYFMTTIHHMHIAMIGQKGIPARFGGVERHVHDLSVHLAQIGHTVTVYSRAWYTQGVDASIAGVHSVHLPSLNTKHLDTISHTLLATVHAMRSDADVLHYHGIGPSLISWLPRLFTPHKKVVTTFHSIDRKHAKWGWFARTVLRIAEWTACKFAHITISVSPTIMQYTRDVYDRQTQYIPNGVTTPQTFYNDSDVKAWGLVPQHYIVMVSRLIPHKGAHYLVRAFTELKKDNPELLRDIKLAIVGDGFHTDSYVDELKALSEEHGDIVFTGFQYGDALNQLLSHARFMVHPSDQEGLPISVLEGMAHGIPVLLSDIPEHKQLVHDATWLFKQGNTHDLKKHMLHVIEYSAEEREAIGEQNRAHVFEQYNWTKLVHDVVNIYETPIVPLAKRKALTPIMKT